jgi:hypothetical protein
MNPPTDNQANPGLYTLHGLADQASSSNADPLQVLQHLQGNMLARQQQVEMMQNNVQAQVETLTNGQAPMVSLHSAIEAISVQCRDTMQSSNTVLNGMKSVLDNLAARSMVTGQGRGRPPVPLPLSPKFTGNDKDMTLTDFKAKLANMFARFPESLADDQAKVHFALNSSDGSAFSYFAAVLNQEVLDSEGILGNFENYINVLERLYGNRNKIHAVETKLIQLRQTGDITEYILQFQTLSSQVRWNEAALVARFKEGLSPSVKRGLTACWDTLTTLQGTQAKAMVAYQNQEHVNRVTHQHHPNPRPRPYTRPQAPVSNTPNTSNLPPTAPMDLDQVRTRRLSKEEKDRRRAQGLCLYCGEGNHFASACPRKAAQLAQVNITFDPESGNDSA